MAEENLNTSVEKGALKRVYGPCALIFCSTETGTWRILRPAIDDESCVYCGMCAKHCPTGVVTAQKDEASQVKTPVGMVTIDYTYCKGCGICANICPKDAIAMIDEREA
jgi:2-oxoacid:acceptor oxidoreductase delta subunit (pyruvate/2-ketoisovalerate family)